MSDTRSSQAETDSAAILESAENAPRAAHIFNKHSRAARVWMETAEKLNVSFETVQKLIAKGLLKVYDPRITEKSFENFCRKHGELINYDLLDEETRDWLRSTVGFVGTAGELFAPRAQSVRKHARVVRKCPTCGRPIRGNAFFRHIKKCGRAKAACTSAMN